MAISQAMCTSFKSELLTAEHNFALSGGDAFRCALYTSSATLGAATAAYTATNEVAGTAYVAKGALLTRVDPTTSGTAAFTDFADVTWASSSITARGAMVFNDDHASDASVIILDFGSDQTSASGDFTIQFPVADASNAIIRIA